MKLAKLFTSLVVLSLASVWIGCGKKEGAKAPEPTVAGQVPGLAAAQEEGNVAADVALLNKTLHNYVALKKHIPNDLKVLATDGFLSSLPKAPPGKKFAIQINPMGYQVVLVGK